MCQKSQNTRVDHTLKSEGMLLYQEMYSFFHNDYWENLFCNWMDIIVNAINLSVSIN